MSGGTASERCKTIHLVRHGQGYHNVAGETDPESYLSFEYMDASLTPAGWQQVADLRKHIKLSSIMDSLQLVVVSPLTRTLQTAAGTFGGDDYTDGETQKPLLVDGVGKAPHKAISSRGAPPFVAVEWCREHYGFHPCDKRQSISTYKTLFPAVDFSDVEDDEDVLWAPDRRENDEELFARARKFVDWLLKREETNIAVVTHSGFLFQLIGTFGRDSLSVAPDELLTHFANCEMRTVVLADKNGQAVWRSGRIDIFAGGV